jgi:GTPase SAR1 family protein
VHRLSLVLPARTQVGKTSLMNRFVERTFDDTELQTQVRRAGQARALASGQAPAAARIGAPSVAPHSFMEKLVSLQSKAHPTGTHSTE